MSSAIPISSRAGLIGNMSCGNIQEYEVNEGGPSWQGLPVDMNVGMEAVVIGDGAATPEASTDDDYDSSDDEARRRLNKTLVAAPCVRLRDSCRWLSTHNSFRAQPALPIRESPKKPRISGGGEGQRAGDDPVRGSGSSSGSDGGGASTPENTSAAGKRVMMTPAQAPSRLVQQVGRPMRGGTTDRHNRMKDSLKTLGRALNTSAKAPAALAIQAAASAALAQSPQAALTAVFTSPHKRAAVRAHSNTNDENKANGSPLAKKSTRALVTRHSHSTSPLAPPKPVLSKKRRVPSCSTLTTPPPGAPTPRSYSSRRPVSKKSSSSSSSMWLEAAWATAAATAKRRAAREKAKAKGGGYMEKQQQERLRSRHRTRSPPPMAAVSSVASGGALDLSCAEDIDVDEVMNSGSEIRTPICRFLLPCWPEGVEGYEEVGGWRRLGGRAASERGAAGGSRVK